MKQRLKLACKHEVEVDVESTVEAKKASSPGISTPDNWAYCPDCKAERLIVFADVPFHDLENREPIQHSEQQMPLFKEGE